MTATTALHHGMDGKRHGPAPGSSPSGGMMTTRVEHLRRRLLMHMVGAAISAMVLVSVTLFGGLWPSQALASGDVGAGGAAKVSYIDPTLGFRLMLPDSWMAQLTPAIHASGRTSTVVLRDPTRLATRIEIAVTRGAQMPSAFRQRGRINARVGSFAAVVEDLPDVADASEVQADYAGPAGASERRNCRVVSLLAGNDYVTGQACGPLLETTDGSLEAALATYLPTAVPQDHAPPTYASTTASTKSASLPPTSLARSSTGAARLHALLSSSAPAHSRAAAIRSQSCADLVASAAERPVGTSAWGRELASPTDSRWSPYPLPGVAVCSNFYAQDGRVLGFDGYLFQCVELANRFLREQWGHGGVMGSAANWFDYADANGMRHPGAARVYPDVQLSADAGQGISAFKLGPGDLLVWQDVLDGKSWMSGLRRSPGHIAVITSADDTHVSFMQENYNDWHSYMTLPVERVANGWHIRDDVSGVAGRIVRGWIHVTENGGMAPPPSNAPLASTRDVYPVDSRGTLSNYHIEHGSGSWAPPLPTAVIKDADVRLVAPVIGTPGVSVCPSGSAGQQEIFATGRDGYVYGYASQPVGGGHPLEIGEVLPAPEGVKMASSPSAVCYPRPGDAPPTQVVFALGSNEHLYRYARLLGVDWSRPQDLSMDLSTGVDDVPGMGLAGAPSAITWVESGVWHEAVYVVGSDGHLYEFQADDRTGWQHIDLTGEVQHDTPHRTSPGSTLVGSPSAIVLESPAAVAGEPTSSQRAVFVLDGDGHLCRYSWGEDAGGGAWSMQDVSQLTTVSDATAGSLAPGGLIGATTSAGTNSHLVGSPSAHSLIEFGHATQMVAAAGSDGKLYEYTTEGGSAVSTWHRVNISSQAAQPDTVAIASSPAGYSYTLAGDPRVRHSLFVISADGHLIEFMYLQSASPEWTFANYGTPARSLAATAPAATTT